MKGIVIFKSSNKASKSEGLLPFLYTGNGEFVKLYFEGDNPFENQTLKAFDAQKVDVIGDYNDSNLFVVESVTAEELGQPETQVQE